MRITVKPVLRDHCHERPPVLTDHAFSAEGPIFRYNGTCHERPPVLTDHIYVANWVVIQDRFYCTIIVVIVTHPVDNCPPCNPVYNHWDTFH